MIRFVARSILVLALVCCSQAASSQTRPANDRLVILVSVDGLASYYMDDPKARMPAMRKLAREGAVVGRMKCSFPTVTWANHTTLATGVEPGRHGVIGNSYFDRDTRKTVPFIPDPLFDKDEIVKVPAIYDLAYQAGLKTAGVIWPASRNAKTLNWQLPDVFEQDLFEKYSTPALLAELRAKGIPYEKQMAWCKAGDAGKPMRDWMYTTIARHIILTHRPNLLLLHLVTVDALEHSTGRQTPEAYWAVNDSDNRVRDLVDAVEAAGLKDKTTFIVTSDHGFITYTNQINPNVLLRKEGLLTVQGSTVQPQKAYCLSQGGGAFLYVLDQANRSAMVARLMPKLAALEGVEAVIESKDFGSVGHLHPDLDPRTPDIMLSAKDGYSFGGAATGDLETTPINPPKGAHGYLPTHPLMYGAFVASGAGIKKGARLSEMSNTDVAPTIAALLGLDMKNVDGRVLTEILE